MPRGSTPPIRLIVVPEGSAEVEEAFDSEIVSIGRSIENHLSIDDLNSSRHHCEIHRVRSGFELHDRDSRNGTFLNGRRVSRTVIRAGDAIEIGTTVIYFQTRPSEPGDAVGRATVDMATRAQPAVAATPTPSDSGRRRLRKGSQGIPALARVGPPPESFDSVIAACDAYERIVADLRRVLALNKTLNEELILRSVLETLLDTVVDLTGAERGFLLLREGDKATIPVSRNIDKESIQDAKEKVSRSITKAVLETGRPVLLGDAASEADERFRGRESILNLNLRSVLSVPLRHRDKVLGALTIDNRFEANCFSKRTLQQVEAIADQAAIAIQNARLFEENLRQRDELASAKDELLRLNELLRTRLERQGEDLAEARAELVQRQAPVELKGDYGEIVTRSQAMREVLRVLDRIRESAVPVLIQGESGTGKELIARALHHNHRERGPFVSENCAAIPANLMESEFFGYVRGAFTGAVADKAGLFELADGGTLFLDEVGDMDLDMQTKLLRVLQDGVLRRIGSKEFKRVDVRIVSATNRDLQKLIAEGRFREDLYYRLNVINVQLPPLRQRKEDIPLLVEHFRKRAEARAGQPTSRFTEESLDALMRYEWPGNVRELENEVERALALTSGQVQAQDLSTRVRTGVRNSSRRSRSIDALALGSLDLKDVVARETEALERELIAEVLTKTNYTKSRSAKLLGISRPTLDAKIEKYDLSKERLGLEEEAEA